MKFIKDGVIIDEKNKNNHSAFFRAGWEVYKEVEKPVVDEVIEQPSEESLRKVLEDAGVDVDGRWGLKRLQEEVNKL